MGGVGAGPAAGPQQAPLAPALREDGVQDLLLQALGDQPVTELAEHREIESSIGQLEAVKSARSAVPAFRPARFSGPLPAPAVRLSTQRALHKPRYFFRGCPHPVVGHGEGMTDPR
jgi:hypothetical protein